MLEGMEKCAVNGTHRLGEGATACIARQANRTPLQVVQLRFLG